MSKNLSAKYHQENKEILQKKIMKDIKIFLKKKNKQNQTRQYDRECYNNLSEEEKQELVEYRRKYYRIKKYSLL